MIKTENVTKYFNRGNPDEVLAVNDVSIEVKEGDFAIFKGPSGSGKTTLLSLIGCMSRPTSGKVIVGDRDVSRLPERFMTEVRRNTFGFIFQQFNLIPTLSALENVMLPMEIILINFFIVIITPVKIHIPYIRMMFGHRI